MEIKKPGLSLDIKCGWKLTGGLDYRQVMVRTDRKFELQTGEVPRLPEICYRQVTKRHLNNRLTVKNVEKIKKKTYLVLVEFLQLVRCLGDCWHDYDV